MWNDTIYLNGGIIMKCKSCGNELTQEMIDVNLCWTCGGIIDENFSEKITESGETHENKNNLNLSVLSQEDESDSNKNTIGSILFVLGIAILVIGTIGSVVIANNNSKIYHPFMSFCVYEFITILSGFFLIGFSEIIQLLHKIGTK